MEKVEYYEVNKWGWECPCGQWNEMDEDPAYEETIYCNECGKEFKPVMG